MATIAEMEFYKHTNEWFVKKTLLDVSISVSKEKLAILAVYLISLFLFS